MDSAPLLSLDEAQARLLDGIEALEIQTVPTAQTAGRYLAAPLLARRTQPAADLSAMDGYAMPAGDTAGPWRMVGESAAGHPYPGKVKAGEAVRISTGAVMPTGADAVLVQEFARREGDRLLLLEGGEVTARHIRRAGFDFREGDSLLSARQKLGPAQIALALSAGHTDLPVHRRPNIAILDSGDELSADPAGCLPHQIPASNGAMLAALAAPRAGKITRIGPVADDPAALAEALSRAEHADVLVTTGGASVGDHDLIRPALRDWGADLHFWRVAIRPGKPLLVARREAQIVLGLPGNPVSGFVTAFLFLLPLLRMLAGAGRDRALPMRMAAPLGAPLIATGGRREFFRANFDGRQVIPESERDSSALRVLASANALIDRPANSPPGRPGDMIGFYLLENGGIA